MTCGDKIYVEQCLYVHVVKSCLLGTKSFEHIDTTTTPPFPTDILSSIDPRALPLIKRMYN